ncbi:D-alanine--D-alanyl carrier protein ligase [Seminavis robusta]|uniref:D-alanine--D-alanyl carrier protein ligase n=1 Tax=Seminavis robusta TaxID=568900 RepID=A0A9N8HF30_9STRA|nr:D-alanine--D-alanyl carrier protein ligase [Seminavis robusta]|eukprot:Sro329_g118820.1 D-alanine--D-alanyl carrier protein ligase (1755) ;mRNA; f:39516-45080
MTIFFSTILEALNYHALESPEKIVFTWVDIKCKEQNKITFKQLEDQSNAVAARLLKLGCKKGDRVMIAYPFGLEFLAGMFGAMKIGVIPCSIYPPNPNELKTDMPKFRRFAQDAGAKYALSTSAFATAMTAASILYKTGVAWIGTDKLSIKKSNPKKPKEYETFMGEPGGICLIQYTSGSTGSPKGVMISHQNLEENCRAGISVTDLDTSSEVALWVPQYHDMGLAGFMSCLYTGSHLVVASPLDFIAKPLLWSDMVETYMATHTAAPNFAYALLLKRLEQANRRADWSCMKATMFGAEPAQNHVVEAVAKTLSIQPGNVYNNYGLAESVVLLTGGPARPDAEGVVCCGAVDSPTIKLRIVEDGKEVENGHVGSIWAQSPRVAVGYFGQPELTISTFANALSGYEGTWLDTGDLGKVVDGQLYVTGRAKDLIIINGKNYYPTDVESSIDDAFGDIIRPGRTAAFQYGEDGIGITVEARKGFDKSVNKDLAMQIFNQVSELHGLFACEVVVLKLGVTPKTTSGKLKRNVIRQTTVAGHWKGSSVLLHLQRNTMPTVTMERSRTYPSNVLPGIVIEAVQAIECVPTMLDVYYSELNLDGIPGICESWFKAVKTTEAIKTMCSQILKHIEDKQPTICQLAHTLSENTDWILIEDTMDFLSQLVHQVFVLQWVTTFMMDSPECMKQKLHNDAEWEAQSHNAQAVPVELQEILEIPDKDPMYGKWPFFLWIKNRSVLALQKLILQSLASPEGPTIDSQVERINKLVCLNILEAVWLEQHNGLTNNSEVGRLLATFPILAARTKSDIVLMEHSTSTWKDQYIAWNMHVVAWIGDQNSSTWMLSKLLLPCIIGDVNAASSHARITSLYLVSQTTGRKIESQKVVNNPILSRRALHCFGKLNLSWAEKLGFYPPPPHSNNQLALASKNEMALNEEYWLSRFDQWGLVSLPAWLKVPSADTHVLEVPGHNTCPENISRYTNTIKSVFESDVDPSKTWFENGLTSLKSARLRNMVEEELHVVLPANFEQLYPTPNALSEFLVTSKGKSFPKQDIDNHPAIVANPPRITISKLQLGLMQFMGSIVILFLVLISILPSYFLASWVLDQCISAESGPYWCQIVWIILPLIFPLYILFFSLDVAFVKFVVIGMYQQKQIELLSWDYIRWWFMDRLIEVWESFVGQFVLETKFIWVFYWLLGADLAWSAKVESYIREFDLVKVGSYATVGYPIRCRKFSLSTGSSGPRLTFHPVIIGKDSQVSGMVSLGAVIGEGSKVEKLSVVEEGAIVPNGVLAKGNPACHGGPFEHSRSEVWQESLLDAFKIMWIFSEAYHFFALSYLVHITLIQVMHTWRYEIILHWFLLFQASSFLALLTSIPLKWVLIGKRDPCDEYGGSLYRQATNWACDFHFGVASWPLTPFFGQTRLWHIILFLHGLDVDIESCISNPYRIFLPSKVDFVKIRKSFVATSNMDLSKRGNGKIEIISSSIGYNANLRAGVKIMQSTIPPRSDVSDSIYDLNQSRKAFKSRFIMDLVLPEVLQILLNGILFLCFIPSFEIGLLALNSGSVGITSCGLAAAVVLQLFVWILLARALETIMLIPRRHGRLTGPFGIYINHVWQFRNGNWMAMLLYGTPMFGYYARMMGAEVDGDLWYYGNSLYEFTKLHFHGGTIVDDSHISGHYIDGNGLTLKDTFVSGLLHPGCYASAGSVVAGEENGPWKVFLNIGCRESMKSESDSDRCDSSISFPVSMSTTASAAAATCSMMEHSCADP